MSDVGSQLPSNGGNNTPAVAEVVSVSAVSDSAAENISPEKTNPIIPEQVQQLLPATLSRLTAGLPMHELNIIIKEAKACEDAM